MRIWLDDLRPMPRGFDIWFKTAPECIQFIQNNPVDFISFDHDLGIGNGTGYDVAKWILEQSATDHPEYGLIPWTIHSANPVGSQNIKYAMQKAAEFASRVFD